MQKIGLEAVLEMAGFTRAAKKYQDFLKKMGEAAEGMGLDAAKVSKTIDTMIPIIGGAGIAAIGAQKAFEALEKVFEFGKEGAVISQTKNSFDNLMASMGVAPDILSQMRRATLNTVDDMTLMSSTMTLVAGTSDELGSAMVNNAPRLLEIAKAANKLNPTLGDTAFLYQSLATGIKRSSPLILDNLGLTIKVGEANQQYADSIGKLVQDLTAEEKQMALLEAALESGDRMIEQVGGNVESMGDKFAVAETQIKNTGDAIKMSLAPAIADAMGGISKFVDQTVIGFELLGAALAKGSIGLQDYRAGIEANKIWAEYGMEAAHQYARAVIESGEAMTTVQWALQKETKRVSAKWQEYSDALRDNANATEEVGYAQEEVIITTEDLEKAQKKLEDALKAVQKAYEKTFSELSKGIIKQRDLGEAAEASAEKYAQALGDLNKSAAKSLGDVRDNFQASLPDKTTVADRLEMAGDAWDEWGLRLQDIIENGVASPWYATLQEMGYEKPPDVGIRAWAQGLQDELYAGRLPDLLPPEWAENVRQQQQEATRAVQAETAKRRAALEEARQAELAAEKEARDQATLELALSIAEQTGLLQAWSRQRFGPDFSQIADSADEVMGLLESGMLDIDGALQEIITNSVAGVQTALDTTGKQAAETKELLDEVLSSDWGAERRGTMAMIGQVIDDEMTDDTPFEIMLRNFEGATQGIINSATLMGLDLDTTFGEIDSEWAATVASQVQTWDKGMTEVEKAIQEKVIEKLEEIPTKIVVTVTTEQEGGEGKQHGGPVTAGVPYVIGEGGPELFVPDQPGTIIPNWAMNLPAITGAGATGGTNIGPTVNVTMNPTINTPMDLAEFEMLTERTVQRAIRGV